MSDDSRLWRGKRVAVIAAGERLVGGADRAYDALAAGLAEVGCEVEVLRVPARENCFDDIMDNYRATASLDLQHFDAVISTKAPSYVVRHPRHVVYLMHTIRAFDDMFETNFPQKTRELFHQRKAVHNLDFAGLAQARAIFCIGKEVKDRLYRKFRLDSEVLHLPLGNHSFVNTGDDGTFFLPGRLHPWKRVDLAIRAVQESAKDVRLNIAGTGEAGEDLRRLAAGDSRITFLGAISDDELVRRYGSCRGVLFVPLREDYGYITIEAFASGKPVITCLDSGEPSYIVRDGVSGLVVPPTPSALATALTQLKTDSDLAARLGAAGARQIASMSWRDVCGRLLDAAFGVPQAPQRRSTSVTVLDMQPIDPPYGGGRLRLLGLYHDLGKDIEATYVGSYDWPGESRRELRHSDRLVEITVPLSDEHHHAAADWAARAGGKTVIDLAFSQQAHLSQDYLDQAARSVGAAEIVVFSHPWVFPLVSDRLRPGQLVVYDSQNVEIFLRRQLLDVSNPFERQLLEAVAQDEYQLIQRADLVLACSVEDARRFTRIYDADPAKLRIIPNGVMTTRRIPPSAEARREARLVLGLADELTAIFLGSAYGPNVDAARFIVDELAPCLPNVVFVIAGGVGLMLEAVPANVRVTGQLLDQDLGHWLAAADLAVNPMRSGSGTNIKMFDFMAMGLPVIATAIGARGIDPAGQQAFLIAEPTAESFRDAIETLHAEDARARIGACGRALVESSFAWEAISQRAGSIFINWLNGHGQKKPIFSVVVPTFNRHDHLANLLQRLSEQIEVDFEVVIVDQSPQTFAAATAPYGFELTYIHTPIRGAIHARNLGASVAKGEIIAFIDDDCIPEPDWLINARPYFADPGIVGIEGRIFSDHYGDPDWRPVSNTGCEGLGFMTANLLVRQSTFQHLGGFDTQFDHPHFREDTDLGWRMLDLGAVPFGYDVAVFHPAQSRAIERESLASRSKFFIKDARLLRKHPGRFRALFEAEGHWCTNEKYLEILISELGKLQTPVPDWLCQYL